MPSAYEDRVAGYRARLLASGARMTRQRGMVLEVLASNSGHTTADKVLAAVQERYPQVNKTTVYRTLDLLCELGVVATTHMGGYQHVYELLDSPHHHLICRKCGAVSELPDAAFDQLRAAIAQEHGFSPYFDHLALFGVCAGCR